MKKWWHFSQKPYKEKEVFPWKLEMALVVFLIFIAILIIGIIISLII